MVASGQSRNWLWINFEMCCLHKLFLIYLKGSHIFRCILYLIMELLGQHMSYEDAYSWVFSHVNADWSMIPLFFKMNLNYMKCTKPLIRNPEMNSRVNFFFFSLGLYITMIFKNWSIINLQYCVSFRCTAKKFSYTYIDIFFFRFFSLIGY